MERQLDSLPSVFRASLRHDRIDLVARRPVFEGVSPESSWALLLADLFHHAVDGAVEIGGQERLRVTSLLRAALSGIARKPHVGRVTAWSTRDELPPLDANAVTLVHALQRANGHVQMTLGRLGWSQGEIVQWAQVIFDLVHCVSSLESLEPTRLFPRVLAEIDQPTTRYAGVRSRVANILPRGDRVCWVSIPRHHDGVMRLVRLDLSLLSRAPIEGLEVALELITSYSPGQYGLADSAEDERIRTGLSSALKGLNPDDLRLGARTECQGDCTLLFFVRSERLAELVAERLLPAFPGSRSRIFVDQSWSSWLELSPDREELRRLANWEWLDELSDSGVATDGAATVRHVFWSTTAEARDRFAESFQGSAFTVISASASGSPGRWECVVEHRLAHLANEIDRVTIELEERALRARALYDGWDVRR